MRMASLARMLAPRSGRTFREWREEWVIPEGVKRAAAFIALLLLGAMAGTGIAVAGLAAALIVISIVACALCVRDFRVGVLMLIVIMPISSSYMFPHAMFGITGLNPLNLLLAATLGSFLLRFSGQKVAGAFLPRPLLWLYIAPLIMGGLIGMGHVNEIPGDFLANEMIFFSGPGSYLRDMLVKPLFTVLYAMLIGAAVARSSHPEKFVTPLLISVWTMAAVVVGFTLASGASLSDLAGTYARHFFSAIGMHANDLGRLYAVAYALLLFIWDKTPSLARKSLLLVSMGVVVIALLLTFSRGAFLGFILVNLIYLFSRRSAKMLLLAAVLVPIALWLMPGAVVSRVEMGWGGGANEVTAGRVADIWAPLMPEIFDHPFFGNGLGAVMWAQAMIREQMFQVGHPHNAYLQLWLDMGALGTVAILGFWLYCWRQFRKLGRDERVHRELQGFFAGAAAGLVSFMVAGFAGSSFEPAPEQAFLWLAVGVMFGMQAKLAAPAPPAAKTR